MSGWRRTPWRSTPASKAAIGPRPGRLAPASASCHGARTKGARARGVGQGEHRVAADLFRVADDVDVEGTRPEPVGSSRADPAEIRLDALGRRQQAERGRPVDTMSTAFR